MVVSLQQFRDRYPAASLTSDLLMVQGDQFVVKVTIQTQEAGTVTGMAVDTNLEAAEDRARQRAIEALAGITTQATAPLQVLSERSLLTPLTPPKSGAKPRPVKKPAGETINLLAIPSYDEIPPVTDAELHPTAELEAPVSKPQLALATQPHLEVTTAIAAATTHSTKQSAGTLEGESVPELASVPPAITATSLVTPDEPLPSAEPDIAEPDIAEPDIAEPDIAEPDIPELQALPAPVNLSDVIAQTDVELRRLGWSVADGREYLESTYGKRSRHDLTDEELLAFLLHLEALPDPQPIE